MRNLCCKCPHYHSSPDYSSGEHDWGCRVFGNECERCPSFWDDEGEADETEMGCNVHPKRLEFLLMRENRLRESWIKSDFKLDRRVKHYSEPIKTKEGYKAIRKKDGLWMGFYTDNFYPNRKGGHRHNHIYNVCNRILFRSKNGRKICIENKREWREIFELQVFGGMNPFCGVNFLDILKKGKYFKQIKRWRLKK